MINVQDVAKKFGDKNVLNGVTFEVAKGETVAIIGPSGCGKSTLLRLIIGFIAPDRGKIQIGGVDLRHLEPDQMAEIRKKIGMVFQSSALFSSLSVFENVAFGLREQKRVSDSVISRTVQEKLELVGLSSASQLMPEELSGGMQKRVSLARALATSPEIILYDEPTTGLDPIMSSSIENLIRDLDHRFQITAIVVTHQLSTVYRVADRIMMLHQGKIIQAGSPEDARKSQNPVISEFVRGGKE